jgi:hypothetical protein
MRLRSGTQIAFQHFQQKMARICCINHSQVRISNPRSCSNVEGAATKVVGACARALDVGGRRRRERPQA